VGVCVCVWVCVSPNVIMCNNNPLHLQRVDGKGQAKKRYVTRKKRNNSDVGSSVVKRCTK